MYFLPADEHETSGLDISSRSRALEFFGNKLLSIIAFCCSILLVKVLKNKQKNENELTKKYSNINQKNDQKSEHNISAGVHLALPVTSADSYDSGDKFSGEKQAHQIVRVVFFLLISLLFYSLLYPPYLLILLATITVDWFLSNRINNSEDLRQRKVLLGLSIAYNLGVLGFFKYALFLANNCVKIINKMIENNPLNASNFSKISNDLPWNPNLPEILLPIGISFFTFQSMSYTIDVYRRILPSERSWVHYAFYLSFFPQLVAGPIVKAREFLPQIRKYWEFTRIPLFAGMSWIAMGAFKKVVLADRLAVLSDNFHSFPDAYSSAFAWVSVLSYSFQIFLDFSGYSDIAIGIALLLGFRLPVNFRLPYFAYSFSEFWRRWHISLSSWLRDYLYVSLGGNRIGKFLTYRNLFIVMLLGGLWHGASWNFLIWGGMHGIFLALERFFGLAKLLENSGQWLRFPFRLLVFFSVTLLWVFFRSTDFQNSIQILDKLFSMDSGVDLGYTMKREFFLVCTTLAIGHFLGKKGFHPLFWEGKIYRPVVHSLGFAVVFIIITLLAVPGKPFIYFVF